MRIIEIAALDNGAHRNQTIDTGSFFGKSAKTFYVPSGWAIIPEDMECENFPFGEITVDDSTPPVVTSWTPGEMPEPEPEPEPAPTQLDIIEAQVTYTAMMTDTLLEG